MAFRTFAPVERASDHPCVVSLSASRRGAGPVIGRHGSVVCGEGYGFAPHTLLRGRLPSTAPLFSPVSDSFAARVLMRAMLPSPGEPQTSVPRRPFLGGFSPPRGAFADVVLVVGTAPWCRTLFFLWLFLTRSLDDFGFLRF